MDNEILICEEHPYGEISDCGTKCVDCLSFQNEKELYEKDSIFSKVASKLQSRQYRLDNQKTKLELVNARRTVGHFARRSQYHEAGNEHNEFFGHQDVLDLLEKQDYECIGCFCDFNKVAFETDHIVPIAAGGKNEISNIQLLCRPCNVSKSNRHNGTWLSEVRYKQVKEYLEQLEEELAHGD